MYDPCASFLSITITKMRSTCDRGEIRWTLLLESTYFNFYTSRSGTNTSISRSICSGCLAFADVFFLSSIALHCDVFGVHRRLHDDLPIVGVARVVFLLYGIAQERRPHQKRKNSRSNTRTTSRANSQGYSIGPSRLCYSPRSRSFSGSQGYF